MFSPIVLLLTGSEGTGRQGWLVTSEGRLERASVRGWRVLSWGMWQSTQTQTSGVEFFAGAAGSGCATDCAERLLRSLVNMEFVLRSLLESPPRNAA
jgi:hypothetical protein